MMRREPMPAFESSRLIPVAPAEVFSLVGDGVRLLALLGDPEDFPLRREVDVRVIDATAGGAVYELSERLAGREMGPVIVRTDPFERDRTVGYRMEGVPDTVFELEAAEGGTLLTLRREYDDEPPGPVRRAATRGLDETTVLPELERQLERIHYALRGSAAEPSDAGGFRMTVVVDAPPSAAFAHVSDGRRLADWLDPSGERAQVEHLAGPRAGAGARYRLTRRDREEPPEQHDFATVDFEAGRRVAYEFPGRSVDVFEVTPGPDGTLLSLERRPVARPKGLRARLVRRAFTADRVVPEIERTLGAIRTQLAD